MSISVSLINMKGGVGKSTLAINLAWHFSAYASWLKKVLVIDLDPQFNASQYLLGAYKYRKIIKNNNPTIRDLFEQHIITPTAQAGSTLNPTDAIVPVARIMNGGKIDLLPSRLEFAFSLEQPAEKESVLQQFINTIKENYDLVLIDCAPTESLATAAAYLASDYILVPVKPEGYLSTVGLPLLAKSLDIFSGQHKNKPEICGIVFNAVASYSSKEIESKQEVKEVAKEYSWNVFEKEIPFSRLYPKSAREGKPIFFTSYACLQQAEDFAPFATEFADRLGFSGYQPLTGQALREDLARLEEDMELMPLIESLRKHGVKDDVIASVMAEVESVRKAA